MQVSKILDAIFGVSKTFGAIFGGQQGNSGMDPPPPRIESSGVPPWVLQVSIAHLVLKESSFYLLIPLAKTQAKDIDKFHPPS